MASMLSNPVELPGGREQLCLAGVSDFRNDISLFCDAKTFI